MKPRISISRPQFLHTTDREVISTFAIVRISALRPASGGVPEHHVVHLAHGDTVKVARTDFERAFAKAQK